MQFRNVSKEDPFSASKRHIVQRINALKEAILSQFPRGPHTQAMRVLINQLISAETSLEGQISKLIALLQQIEVTERNPIWQQDQLFKYSHPHNFKDEIGNMETQSTPKRYQKYYDFSRPYDYRMSDHLQPPHYQQIPYVYTPGQNIRTDSFSSLQSSKSSNNLSMADLHNRTDSINEKDLFSFRTQEAASPLKGSKQAFERKHSQNYEQNPYEYLFSEEKEKSRSKSLKNSRKSNLSKSKDRKQPSKGINYDGKAIEFKALRKSIKQSQMKQRQTSELNHQSLLKRVQKRIDFSKCVVGSIEHSTCSANNSYVANRYRQQQQLRCQVIGQLQRAYNSCSFWR